MSDAAKTILDFLSTTDVGRLAPVPVEEDDAQSEASVGGTPGAEVGGRGTATFSTRTLYLSVRGRSVGVGGGLPL